VLKKPGSGKRKELLGRTNPPEPIQKGQIVHYTKLCSSRGGDLLGVEKRTGPPNYHQMPQTYADLLRIGNHASHIHR